MVCNQGIWSLESTAANLINWATIILGVVLESTAAAKIYVLRFLI